MKNNAVSCRVSALKHKLIRLLRAGQGIVFIITNTFAELALRESNVLSVNPVKQSDHYLSFRTNVRNLDFSFHSI